MSKIAWVCGVSLSLAFFAVACADSDETPTNNSDAGKGGDAGKAGAGGGTSTAGRGGSSGASAGAGDAAGEGGAPSGEGGDSSAGAMNGGSAGDDGAAGQGGAPATEVCLADGTTLQVAASGFSAYVFSGLPAAWSAAGPNNAPLTLCRGYTYTFALNVAGHPFYFKTAQVLGAASAYDTGVTSNGKTTGNVVFVVPAAAPDALFYQCSNHAPMTGTVTIVDPS